MSPAPSMNCVLIVDRSAESREVLRALLERTGTRALEASRPDEAAVVAESERPSLIVLDVDSDPTADRQATRQLCETASRMDTPIVVLGKLSRHDASVEPREWVAKPYHYGHLLRRIEHVLEHRRAA